MHMPACKRSSRPCSLTANQAAAIFTQVSQALGAGRVELEEFGTVIDNAPTIVAALAKELDVCPIRSKLWLVKARFHLKQLSGQFCGLKRKALMCWLNHLMRHKSGLRHFKTLYEDVVVALTSDVIPCSLDALDDIGIALEALIPAAQVTGRAIALAFELALIPVQGFAKLVSDIANGNWGEVFKFNPGGLDKITDAFGKAFAP